MARKVYVKNDKFISGLVRDIKFNRMGYIKSEIVANKVRAYDPEIEIVYRKEEKLYIASYKPKDDHNGSSKL